MLQPSGRHNFSAPSKEALHLSLLARAVEGDPLSLSFFAHSCPSPPPCDVYQHVISLLRAKAATLSRFNAEYPGYGGFLPWFQINVNDRSLGISPTDDWQNRVPALDNGQMAWGFLAVSTSLTLAGEAALADVYGALFQRMAGNALRIFYDSDRRVHRDITRISNERLPPEQVVYSAEGSGCLCDPYEGELFVFFADLYGNWTGYPQDARDRVWINRRSMLQVHPPHPPHPCLVTLFGIRWMKGSCRLQNSHFRTAILLLCSAVFGLARTSSGKRGHYLTSMHLHVWKACFGMEKWRARGTAGLYAFLVFLLVLLTQIPPFVMMVDMSVLLALPLSHFKMSRVIVSLLHMRPRQCSQINVRDHKASFGTHTC